MLGTVTILQTLTAMRPSVLARLGERPSRSRKGFRLEFALNCATTLNLHESLIGTVAQGR
jgi:hypothetical protein